MVSSLQCRSVRISKALAILRCRQPTYSLLTGCRDSTTCNEHVVWQCPAHDMAHWEILSNPREKNVRMRAAYVKPLDTPDSSQSIQTLLTIQHVLRVISHWNCAFSTTHTHNTGYYGWSGGMSAGCIQTHHDLGFRIRSQGRLAFSTHSHLQLNLIQWNLRHNHICNAISYTET